MTPSFPPPIRSIGRGGKPCVCFRTFRADGRFVLTQVVIPGKELLQASREGGRLRLRFANPAADDAGRALPDGTCWRRRGRRDGEGREAEQEGGILQLKQGSLSNHFLFPTARWFWAKLSTKCNCFVQLTQFKLT